MTQAESMRGPLAMMAILLALAVRPAADRSDAVRAKISPEIVAGHGGYGLCWTEGDDAYFWLLDPSGVPKREPVLLGTHVALCSIAVGTDGFAVAWDAQRDGGMFVAQLSRAGDITSPAIRIAHGHAYSPKIAYGDGVFGIAWYSDASTDRGDDAALVNFAAVRPDNSFAMPPTVVDGDGTETFSGHLSLAAGPSEFAIAWSRCPLDDNRRARCRWDAELVLLRMRRGEGPRRSVVSRSHEGREFQSTSLVWADGWAIAVAEGDALGFVTVRDGDPRWTRDLAFGHRADVVWTGSVFGLGIPPREHDVEWRELDRDGRATGRATVVNDVPGTAHYASMAWGFEEYAFAWIDSRSERGALYFARLGADGRRRGMPIRLRP